MKKTGSLKTHDLGRTPAGGSVMPYLWLVLLPLLFLPDFTFSATSLGRWKTSDYMIGIYILCAGYAGRTQAKLFVSGIIGPFFLFLSWAMLSTLTIPLRYDSVATHQVLFSFIKLVKFSIYGVAGILTVKAVASRDNLSKFYWSLLGVALVLSLSFIVLGTHGDFKGLLDLQKGNGKSVAMAMIIVYLIGLLLFGCGTKAWRKTTLFVLVLSMIGIFFTGGRGGWFAMGAGLGYFFCRLFAQGRFKYFVRLSLMTGIFFLIALWMYAHSSPFKHQIDRTFHPSVRSLKYNVAQTNVDEGGRLLTWRHEFPKFKKAWFWGTGFYHRSKQSTLWSTGSHNFFLQMFLETGMAGGFLMLIFFYRMFKQSCSAAARSGGVDLPTEAAVITGFVGGLSGEYFYGGVIFFTLFLIYAAVGALSCDERQSTSSGGKKNGIEWNGKETQHIVAER